MADGIESIRNPVGRGALGAWVGFSAATVVAGAAIGFLDKEDSAFQTAGYIAGGSAIAGAIIGAATPPAAKSSTTKSARAKTVTSKDGWTDWRDFVVVRKVKESAEITSFYLKPKDGQAIPSFKPGQFLTIRLDIPDQPRPVIRTYSLSNYVDPVDHYRLSIKRELSPKGLDVPPGLSSNFMHDQIEEGSVIPAKPPSGKFVLDLSQARPAVLISNGVGITPMISMAKAVARLNPSRHIWFLHGSRNGDFHALRDDMAGVSDSFSNLHLYYRYSRPQPEDEGAYHSTGYVDAEMLEQVIIPEIQSCYGSADADYFLCGSPPFMDSLREGLAALGVPKSQVFFESFSKPKAAPKAEKVAADKNGSSAEVTFARSGKTAVWHPGDGTLLEFAEAQGLSPDYSCRQGVCLTCMCAIENGEVDYDEDPDGTPDDGSVLICVSKPKTPTVVLDV
ncbi:MAG: 2Fe-2S iron-sulfur cluster-binding protein [Elainellaceae cyanobacterium]